MPTAPMGTALGLWQNCQDSIRHGLTHAANLVEYSDHAHDQKWVVLSAAHAAECYCNCVILVLNPAYVIEQRYGRDYFHSLRITAPLLLSEEPYTSQLESFERPLIAVFKDLGETRNAIMHHVTPAALDISTAAIALLGLLKSARRRFGTATSDLFDRDPPVEQVLAGFIRGRPLQTGYRQIAEQYAQLEARGREIEDCPYCSARTVLDSECVCCFEELAERRCPACDEDYLVVAYRRDEPGSECTRCGEVS